MEYKSKGFARFAIINNEVKISYLNKKYFINQHENIKNKDEFNKLLDDTFKVQVGKLLTGEEFLEQVKTLNIQTYNGYLYEVFIDKYRSNLGLVYDNFIGGEFLVDENKWLEICKKHKVEVYWE